MAFGSVTSVSIVVCLLSVLTTWNRPCVSGSEYGNLIMDRSTSGMDENITAGPRIWIDDPLDKLSIPGWGFLKSYKIFIQQSSADQYQTLYLQIWTYLSGVDYKLKWQKNLTNYNTGQEYQVNADVDSAGYLLEVTPDDRIGFVNFYPYNPVALDLEVDDETQTSAHRTYFRLLQQLNNTLPAVGDVVTLDNNALRGTYSIGVVLDTAPPRGNNQIYCGKYLMTRKYVHKLSDVAVLLPSINLESGRVVAFYFRLKSLTSSITANLMVWSPTADPANYTLIYNKDVTITAGDQNPYTKVQIDDGPQVNSSCKLGFIFPGTIETIFYSLVSNAQTRFLYLSSSLQVGNTYRPDTINNAYEYSVGVIIDKSSNP